MISLCLKCWSTTYVEQLTTLASNIIQIIRLNNLLEIPEEIYLEFEDRQVEDGLINIASADVEEQVIVLSPAIACLSHKQQIEVICHELVHLEQGKLGWLEIDYDNEQFVWFGYRFQLPKNHDEYINFPWERDAHRRDKQIAHHVQKHMKGMIREISGTC